MLKLLAFAVTVAYFPGLPSAATFGRWWTMALAVPLLLRTTGQPVNRGTLIGAALLGWAMLTFLWTTSPHDTIGFTIHMIAIAGVFALAQQEHDLAPVLTAIAIGVTAQTPFAVAQWWYGVQPVQNTLMYGIGDHAAVGLMGSKAAFAEVATLAFIAMLLLGRLTLAAIAAFCMYLSGARECVAMLGGAALAWAWPFPVARKAAICATGAAAGLVAFASVFDPGPFTDRITIWRETIAGITVLGHGAGSFAAAFPRYEWAHNDFLQMAFELGLVGAALLLALLAVAFRADTGEDRTAKACLGALVAGALVSFPLANPATAMAIALLLGHLVGADGRARQRQLHGGADDSGGLRPQQRRRPAGTP